MATRMQQRRGTAAEWAAQNPILAVGEIGYEIDSNVVKMGDGITPWNTLTKPDISLNDLTDVDTSGLAVDTVLSYDGAKWATAPLPQPQDPGDIIALIVALGG